MKTYLRVFHWSSTSLNSALIRVCSAFIICTYSSLELISNVSNIFRWASSEVIVGFLLSTVFCTFPPSVYVDIQDPGVVNRRRPPAATLHTTGTFESMITDKVLSGSFTYNSMLGSYSNVLFMRRPSMIFEAVSISPPSGMNLIIMLSYNSSTWSSFSPLGIISYSPDVGFKNKATSMLSSVSKTLTPSLYGGSSTGGVSCKQYLRSGLSSASCVRAYSVRVFSAIILVASCFA